MITVQDVARAVDGIAPFDTQLDWDNSGLLVGEMRRRRQELFESLQLYYRVFVLKEDISEYLA